MPQLPRAGAAITQPFRLSQESFVANTAQAKKRARQAEVHRARNAAQRSLMRSRIKAVLKAIAAKDKDKARDTFRAATSYIDRMAGRGIIHKNTAARYKGRLNERLRALA
jgi:small subunit ribosomal protein S20